MNKLKFIFLFALFPILALGEPRVSTAPFSGTAPGFIANRPINFNLPTVGNPAGPNYSWFMAGYPSSVNTASGQCTNTTTECWLMQSAVNDSVNAASATGGVGGLVDFYIVDNAGGSQGNRTAALFKQTIQSSPTDATAKAYIGSTSQVVLNAALPSATSGGVWAQTNYATINGTGGSSLSLIGVENDLSIASPASTLYVDGVEVVLTNTNNVSGTNENAGFLVSAQATATPTMTCAFCVGAYQGNNPLASSGYVLRYLPHNGSHAGPSITGGIKFDDFTFSGNAFSSPGFAVNGTGGILNTGITADTAHTDATVCEDTTTHQFYFGTGTLGVCLGTSSIRFKKDVKPSEVGLTQILALEPKTFWYKNGYGDNGAHEQIGFIAEDVANVLPKLTRYDSEGKPSSVDILGIVPVLVKAVQEQQQELNGKLSLSIPESSAITSLQRQIYFLWAVCAVLSVWLGIVSVKRKT